MNGKHNIAAFIGQRSTMCLFMSTAMLDFFNTIRATMTAIGTMQLTITLIHIS